MIHGDRSQTYDLWAAVRSAAPAACAALSKKEATQLHSVTYIALPALLDAEAVPVRQYQEWIGLCDDASKR